MKISQLLQQLGSTVNMCCDSLGSGFLKRDPTVVRLDIDACRVTIWDVGGQSGIRVIWDKYYSEANAIIYVVDSADVERLSEARQELLSVLEHKDVVGVPVLILANKQDLPGALPSDQISDMLSLDDTRPYQVVDVVAITGSGLKPAILWLLEQISERERVSVSDKRRG